MTTTHHVDLATIVGTGDGVHWTLATPGDLNANLVVLDPGHAIEAHTNNEVDVVMVVLAGTGHATVDGVERELRPDVLLHIPRGTSRAVVADDAGMRYLTVHRRRGPLQIGTSTGQGPR